MWSQPERLVYLHEWVGGGKSERGTKTNGTQTWQHARMQDRINLLLIDILTTNTLQGRPTNYQCRLYSLIVVI